MYDIATECPSEEIRKQATMVGFATMVLLQSKKYSLFHILTIKIWLEQAIMLDQIKFYFDWNGHPIGYVTWAYLAEDVEKRLVEDPDFVLHYSEWNEGGNAWIIDFCMPTGNAKEGLRYFFEHISETYSGSLSWARRGSNNKVRKVSSINMKTRNYTSKCV